MNYKIFDLGGSFLKIYCSKTNNINRIEMFSENIISLYKIKSIILENIEKDTEYIGLSSQMHGFILFDENNKNISEFITWKNLSSINILNENIFNDFYKTGLQKRNDLPINNLNNFFNNNLNNLLLNNKIYFKNITEGILDISNNITHSSMACGSGFYDIFNNEYINEYINYFNDKFNIKLLFDNVTNDIQISGFIKKYNKNIPVYVGIGDFQASLYGTNIKSKSLLINMATGSQIAQLINKENINNLEKIDKNFSYRPYFNNYYIKCITHIPSGRFLNIFYNFFEELNINMWKYFDTLTINDINESNININTNIFSENGIIISNIHNNNLNLKNIISSILYNYIYQYIKLIKENNIEFEYIILSGGIPKKIPLIKTIFEKEFNKNVIINEIDDDSLIGVLNLINK
jgi:sugar (pentulose or hexulose) kinase